MAGRAPQRRSGLRARLSIVAVAFLVLFLVSSVMAGLTVRAWNQAVEDRAAIRLMRDGVAELRLALSDQESGLNGYMRSGDPEFLVP